MDIKIASKECSSSNKNSPFDSKLGNFINQDDKENFEETSAFNTKDYDCVSVSRSMSPVIKPNVKMKFHPTLPKDTITTNS